MARKKIALLISKIQISSTDTETVLNTIKNKQILDFEDGLEYFSALGSGCQLIITEDRDDFYFSKIEVLNCRQFMDNVSIK